MSIGCLHVESLPKKPRPGFERRSNQASIFAAPAKSRPGPCTSLASAASFLTSTTWTTLLRATPCPRELSTMESVGSAHVMVCPRRGGLVRDGVLFVLVWVPPELKSTVALQYPTGSRAAVQTASGSPCRSATDRGRSTPRVCSLQFGGLPST